MPRSLDIKPLPYSIAYDFHMEEKKDPAANAAMRKLTAFSNRYPDSGSTHPEWPADEHRFLLGRIENFLNPLGYTYHTRVLESFRWLDRYHEAGLIPNTTGTEAKELLKEWHQSRIDLKG